MVQLEQLKEKLVEMDREKTFHVKFLKDYQKVIEAIAALAKDEISFQDDDGVVYRIERATGEFVEYKPWTVKRTRREGETRGTLSMEEAKRMGYQPRGA